jgi:hypothetical protein
LEIDTQTFSWTHSTGDLYLKQFKFVIPNEILTVYGNHVFYIYITIISDTVIYLIYNVQCSASEDAVKLYSGVCSGGSGAVCVVEGPVRCV